MDKRTIIGFIIVLVIIVIGAIFLTNNNSGTSAGPDLTAFAQCLKAKGAIFYGAFWCPHCQATKRMFGSAVKELPYVECSTPDGNGQTQICIDKGIKQYPTWIFADGTQLTGELTLQQLADKTSCTVPGTASSVTTTATSTASSTTSQAK